MVKLCGITSFVHILYFSLIPDPCLTVLWSPSDVRVVKTRRYRHWHLHLLNNMVWMCMNVVEGFGIGTKRE